MILQLNFHIKKIYLPLWFVAFLIPCLVWSNTLEYAETLYNRGEYLAAAEHARRIDTAKSHSLAAKSLLVEATYKSEDKNKFSILKQAMEDADRALELDPSQVDAHLQLALAMGSIAELRKPVTTYLKGYVKKGKYHIDQAMKLEPENPWVHGILGVWHLQIVNRSSKWMARKIYGANEEIGISHCQLSQKYAPDELQLLYGCAISLYELDPERHKKKAGDLLESIVNRKPANITESLVINQAKIILRDIYKLE